jgi:hypothetical protein
MTARAQTADDALSDDVMRIELRVGELRQLFNAMDPSPFRERDLDPRVEAYIVEWARELPRDAPMALVVHLDRAAGLASETAMLRDAVGAFFASRAKASRVRMRVLLRVGRISLLIGLLTLAAFVVLADVVGNVVGESAFGQFIRETMWIGGWVAMWRPMEIFLYDWWPILAEARRYDRLAAMPIRLVYTGGNGDAWRTDWPAAAVNEKPAMPLR